MKNLNIINDKENWWFDCDPGIDDMTALSLLYKNNYNTNLVAISSCFGNTNIYNTTNNIIKINDIFKKSYPFNNKIIIFKGSDMSIDNNVSINSHYYHGKNGLMDMYDNCIDISNIECNASECLSK